MTFAPNPYSTTGYYVSNGPYFPLPYAVTNPASVAAISTGGAFAMSDQTSSSGVGAVAWPDGGIPGRAIEIALDPGKAFTFLQGVLMGVPGETGGILQDVMIGQNKPLMGYISVRVCTQTATLMGMQKFAPSVMIEIVGYRSPEADILMDTIQEVVLSMNANAGLNAMLHWGLENDQMAASDLLNTPVNQPIAAGASLTKLQAFQQVRKYFLQSHRPVFDNIFTKRLEI